MKQLLITIAALVLVGCGESQQSAPAPEAQTAKAPDISIHDAARKGNIDVVKQHLAAGTDVNIKDDVGDTPLPWAAYGYHKEIVELLIENGADVNAKNDLGNTPLYMANLGGSKEITELLIANGADVNAKYNGGSTPLHTSSALGHKEIVELLIAKGTDVNAKKKMVIHR